jgi:hypothetical protein
MSKITAATRSMGASISTDAFIILKLLPLMLAV